MSYQSVVISSGHGLYVRGASGILDEVDEARRVVDAVAPLLREQGVETTIFHDDVSRSQDENLNRIVDFHNSRSPHQLDVSVHFNAFEQRTQPVGTEVYYYSQSDLANEMSAAIASCGFINRGGKKSTELFFLNSTAAKSILIEVCFVDSTADANMYRSQFDEVVHAIAGTISGEGAMIPPSVVTPVYVGRASTFGGPYDQGVSPSEGLAFISSVEQAPHLFLPVQPAGTTGLARRLNPYTPYLAMRWDYDKVSKEELLHEVALVRAVRTGIALKAFPSDWGPNENTGRIADLSPSLMDNLGIVTDEEVEIVFPYRE